MKWIVLMLVLLLGGCGFTTQGDIARKAFAEGSMKAAKSGLENMEFGLCQLAPVGAIRDRYGKDPAMAAAYKTICEGDPDTNIVTPE